MNDCVDIGRDVIVHPSLAGADGDHACGLSELLGGGDIIVDSGPKSADDVLDDRD